MLPCTFAFAAGLGEPVTVVFVFVFVLLAFSVVPQPEPNAARVSRMNKLLFALISVLLFVSTKW